MKNNAMVATVEGTSCKANMFCYRDNIYCASLQCCCQPDLVNFEHIPVICWFLINLSPFIFVFPHVYRSERQRRRRQTVRNYYCGVDGVGVETRLRHKHREVEQLNDSDNDDGHYRSVRGMLIECI